MTNEPAAEEIDRDGPAIIGETLRDIKGVLDKDEGNKLAVPYYSEYIIIQKYFKVTADNYG